MEELRNIGVRALDGLVAAGADKAKCVVLSGKTDEFNIESGKFSLFRTTFDSAINMSCIKDNARGTVALNRLDAEAVDGAIAECIANAVLADKDEAWDIAPRRENKSFTVGCPVADADKLFERTAEFIADARREFPAIMLEQVIVAHRSEKRAVMNTNGVEFFIESGAYDISVMFSAHDGEATSSFAGDEVCVSDLDTPFIELGSIRRSLAEVSRQVYTKPVEGKFEGAMVLPAGCLADFLYMLFQNTVEDGVMLDKTSMWKDKLGQKVADERITVSVSPLDPRVVRGERVTADGFEAHDYKLIDRGVLSSFMLSLYASNKLGLPRAENSAWNLTAEAGDKSIDELISSIERGIYVGRFSGGEPTSNGDFSGVAKNSFLIENGKLTDAVSETMISGNIADMLNSLRGISSEVSCNGSTALPYMAFDGITVSGK